MLVFLLPAVHAQINRSMFGALDMLWSFIYYIFIELPTGAWAASYYKLVLWIIFWAVIRKIMDKWPLFKGEHH